MFCYDLAEMKCNALMTQVARYQPNSAPAAQLATPAFATSPAQSILRRFFSVDDTYVSCVALSL